MNVSCLAAHGVGLDHAGETANLVVRGAPGGLVDLQRAGGGDNEVRGAMIARLVEVDWLPSTAGQDRDPPCGSDLQGAGAQVNGNRLAIEGSKGGQHAGRTRQVRGIEFDGRVHNDGYSVTDRTGASGGICWCGHEGDQERRGRNEHRGVVRPRRSAQYLSLVVDLSQRRSSPPGHVAELLQGPALAGEREDQPLDESFASRGLQPATQTRHGDRAWHRLPPLLRRNPCTVALHLGRRTLLQHHYG